MCYRKTMFWNSSADFIVSVREQDYKQASLSRGCDQVHRGWKKNILKQNDDVERFFGDCESRQGFLFDDVLNRNGDDVLIRNATTKRPILF